MHVGLKYTSSDYGLASVFDLQKRAYRMININTLKELKVVGASYEVEK